MAAIIIGIFLACCVVWLVVSEHQHNQQRNARAKEREDSGTAYADPRVDREIAEAYAKVAEAEKEIRIRGMVVDMLKIEEAIIQAQLDELDAKESKGS